MLNLPLENIEVNFSMAECLQSFMAEKVLAQVSRAGLEPRDLVIELTETGRDSLPVALQRNMNALSSAGIGIAMDDFGTGYANMMQLMNLPFTYIKFDRSLVNEHAPGPRTRGDALSRLVTIFGQQDTCIIAEGIETEAQYRRMLALGIDRLQGYLFSKPLSEEAFIARLAGGPF
jgi:EAL domain-containing protein (putative c-di-GMP-specific phosphodiesterase class I)